MATVPVSDSEGKRVFESMLTGLSEAANDPAMGILDEHVEAVSADIANKSSLYNQANTVQQEWLNKNLSSDTFKTEVLDKSLVAMKSDIAESIEYAADAADSAERMKKFLTHLGAKSGALGLLFTAADIGAAVDNNDFNEVSRLVTKAVVMSAATAVTASIFGLLGGAAAGFLSLGIASALAAVIIPVVAVGIAAYYLDGYFDDLTTNDGSLAQYFELFDSPQSIIDETFGSTESIVELQRAFIMNNTELSYQGINDAAEILPEFDTVQSAPLDFTSDNHFHYGDTTNDIIEGSQETDYLFGLEGNDYLLGMDGDDYLFGGEGKDILDGGEGNDDLKGHEGDDKLIGNNGDDRLEGGDGNDKLEGGIGTDTLIGGVGNDLLEGGEGNDTYIFNGSFGFDEIKDQDGIGNIIINNQTVGEVKLVDGTDAIYRSADGNIDVLRINEGSSTTLMLSQRAGGVGDGGMVVIRDWSEGDLGITLNNEVETSTPPAQTFIGNGNSNVVGYTGPFLGGDPIAHMEGGAGDDLVRGLMGDTLLGGIGDDWIIARYQAGRDLLTTHIDGGEGNDIISTVNINSVIHGGAGNDFIQDSAELDVRLTEGFYRRENADDIEVTRETLWQDFLSYIVRVPDATRPEFYNVSPVARPQWERFDSVQAGVGYYHRTRGENFNGLNLLYSQVYYGDEMPDADHEATFNDAFTGFLYVDLSPAAGYEAVQDKKGSSYFGDAGYDTIYGRWFADYISGGTEDDRLYGMEGHDVIDGGEHNDSIHGGEGNDTLIGGAGDDVIYGADAYSADDKLDLPDDDVMFGGDGSDTLRGGRGNDTLNGGKDNDYLYGDEGDDYLDGGDGKDNLYGGIGNDTLVSEEGSFYLNGGEGDDTYILAKGLIQNDSETGALSSIDDISGNNTLAITGVSDFSSLGVTASGNNLIIDTGDGQFIIRNGLTNGMLNMAVGTAADAYASGNSPLPSTTPTTTQTSLNHLLLTHLNTAVTRTSQIAGEQLTGGLQNDTLTAHAGGSTLVGGRGNDALRGGVGDDTYLLRSGDGLDTITEAGGTNNVIKLDDGITQDQVTLRRSSGNLILTLASGERMTVSGMFNSSSGALVANRAIHELTFSDGTTWDLNRIREEAVRGNDGNETLYGFSGDDVLRGGAGNDDLRGLAGNDIYEFNLGDGQDTIIDNGGTDVIRFGEGIEESRIIVRRSGANLILSLDSGERITVNSMFNSSTGVTSTTNAIEQIEFADGTVWEVEQLQQRALEGTDGSDTLYGFPTDDVFRGGTGNDQLYGVGGNDIYEFNLGDGQDIITDNGGDDAIYFGEGVDGNQITVRRDGTNLILSLDSGERITVNSMFNGTTGATSTTSAIERIEFADGNVWGIEQLRQRALEGTDGADALYGFTTDDVLRGGAGNDQLYGFGGNDIYEFNLGDGQDTISDNGGTDTIRFGEGINEQNIQIRRNTFELEITMESGERIRVYQMFNSDGSLNSGAIESIAFSNGTAWNLEQIKQAALIGTSGADSLYGFETNDLLEGEQGDDRLEGSGGDDIYFFERGDGRDRVIESAGTDEIFLGGDILADDINLRRQDGNLIISIGEAQSINIVDMFNASSGALINDRAVEILRFSDGETWNVSQMLVNALRYSDGNDVIYGFDGDDYIVGGNGNDSLHGAYGNDVLIGGIGRDSLYGGDGDDTYVFSEGDFAESSLYKTIYDWSATNTIHFNDVAEDEVVIRRTGNSLSIYVGNSRVSVSDMVDSFSGSLYTRGISTIQFADGNNWNIEKIKEMSVIGTESDDNLYGFNTSDYIVGGSGDDLLNGGAGDDIYSFGIGHGDDELVESEGIDVIRYLNGITTDDISVRRYYSDLILSLSDDDIITVDNMFYSSSGNVRSANAIEQLEFADGTIWNLDQLRLAAVQGSGLSDFIQGFSGDDTVSGGKGNDWLEGFAGNDTYEFNLGDGKDTIRDTGGADIIRFGAGITPDDVMVHRYQAETYFVFTNGDQIKVEGQMNSGVLNTNYFIEQIEFSNGIVWDLAEIEAQIANTAALPNVRLGSSSWDELHVSGGVGDFYLNGFDGIDDLSGGSGNDTLVSGYGFKFLRGAAGDDTYFITSDTNETIIEGFMGFGVDRILFAPDIMPDDVRVSISYPTTWSSVQNGKKYYLYMEDPATTQKHAMYLNFNGSQIELRDLFDYDYYSRGAVLTDDSISDTVEFFDGTVWSIHDLMDLALTGSDYNDRKRGTTSDDLLTGGGGNDFLETFDGDDSIIGGSGNDYLKGGEGNDTYHFSVDSGEDTIIDIAGVDNIVFDSNVSSSEVTVRRDISALIFEWGDNQSVYVEDAVIETETGFELGFRSIESVAFGDGTIWNSEDLLQIANGGTVPGDPLFANEPIPARTYSAGLKGAYYGYHQPDNNNVNLLNLNQVREVINNNESDAEFIGQSIHYMFARTLLGSGTVLQTFLGSDADSLTADPVDTSDAVLHLTGQVTLEAGDHNFRVQADDGYSIVIDGNVVAEYNGKQGSTRRTHDTFSIAEAGKHDIEIIYWDEGSSHDFRVEISHDGGASYQKFEGATLSHEVDSSVGDNVYDFARDDGAVAISEQGGTDQLNLDSAIATDQLWFERSGDDLLLSIIGTTDAIVVDDWYVDPVHQVETFATSDGAILHSADVDNLVQAMAAFAPPAMGETSLSQAYRDSLEPVIAANWQ